MKNATIREAPRDMAHMLVIDMIGQLAREYADTAQNAYERRVAIQIARIHNRLLDASGLDGLHIEIAIPAPARRRSDELPHSNDLGGG